MKRILAFLKKLFKKIFKAVKKAVGWLMKNWKILALAFLLAVMFLTPAFLSSIGLSWFSGAAATVQTTLGVSSGWSLYAGIGAAGGAAILIAPKETAALISKVGSNIADVADSVGSSAGSIISGAIGGIATSIAKGSVNTATTILKTVALSPVTWVVGAAVLGYLFWPAKDKSEVDTETATVANPVNPDVFDATVAQDTETSLDAETATVANPVDPDVSDATVAQDTETNLNVSDATVAQTVTGAAFQGLSDGLNQQDGDKPSKTESLRFS